jgi:hypothetical protein
MTAGSSPWSTANKVGLAMLALAATANLVPTPENQGGPPLPVLIAAAALGLVALIAVFLAWTRPSKKAALVAVGVSFVNALLAVPAFFEPGVSSMMQALAGVFIAWTVAAVALTLVPNRNG